MARASGAEATGSDRTAVVVTDGPDTAALPGPTAALLDRPVDQLGPAVNSGHSLFVYGPPGNGKTVIAQGIKNLLDGDIRGYDIHVAGHVIRCSPTGQVIIATLPDANALRENLRLHHNQKERHRELRSTPQAAWNLALKEKRSVLRPAPQCPWWPYVWSQRAPAKVGPDGRLSIGTQRLRIERPCGSTVTRCLHPNGDVSVLLHPPAHGQLPTLLLHLPTPKTPVRF